MNKREKDVSIMIFKCIIEPVYLTNKGHYPYKGSQQTEQKT